MKIGQANAHFIADAHNPRVSLADMRRKWAAGDYGKPRSDYAQGWLQIAGKEPT
jgi:hypothetical protein